MKYLCFITLLSLGTFAFGQNRDTSFLENNQIKYISYFDSGEVKQEGTYDLEGERDGKWTAYGLNREITSTVSFYHGLKHGEWIIYNDRGQLISKMYYDMGKRVGTWKSYKNGELAQTREY